MDEEKLKNEITKDEKKNLKIESDIAEKNQTLNDLKKKNAEEIERTFNQKRKPASINQRRNRILLEQTKIDELVIVKSNIENRLKEMKEKLFLSQQKKKAVAILKDVHGYCDQYREIEDTLDKCKRIMEAINRSKNPLTRLIQMHYKSGLTFNELNVDPREIIDQFTKINISNVPDEYTIDAIEVQRINALNELRAISQGKSHYSVIKPKERLNQLPEHINPEVIEAERYNQRQREKMCKAGLWPPRRMR